MMPVVRDIVRNVTNPAVAVLLLVLALSGATASQIGANTPIQVTPPLGVFVAVTYNYSSAYQFNVLAFTKSSETTLARVSEAQVNLAFLPANQTGPMVGQVGGRTNAQGFVSLDWDSAPCDCALELNVSATSGGLLAEVTLRDPPPQNLTPLFGVFSIVPSGFFLSKPLLTVAFPNDLGQVPPGINLTYTVLFQAPSGPSTPVTSTIGPLTSVVQSFPSVQSLPLSDFDMVQLNLTGRGGATIYSLPFQFQLLDPRFVSETQAAAGLESGVETVSFLAALTAVLVGFVGYGRDRLSGSLDPVLALPVTRTRIILTRYSAAAVVAVAGSILGTVVLGLTVSNVAGEPLPASIWFAMVAAFAVESMAFVGLSILAAHLTRSSTLLLVVLVLVTAALTILWIPFVSTVTHFAQTPLNLSTFEGQSTLVGWSPAQLSVSIIGSAVLSFNGEGPYLLPAVTNVGLLSALAVGWTVVPIIMAWLLLRYRD